MSIPPSTPVAPAVASHAPRLPWWRRAWRVLRVLIFAAVCLVTVGLLLNAGANWRAARKWEQCRRSLMARGEKLDWNDYAPPPTPPAQNFAKTPLLVAAVKRKEPLNPLDLHLGNSGETPALGSWRLDQATDLQAWSDYYRRVTNPPTAPSPRSAAEQVLQALSPMDQSLAELRAAARRPQAAFDGLWGPDAIGMSMRHLAVAKGLANTLALHAAALEGAGQGVEALENLQVNWRLMDALKSEQVLLSSLVRLAIHEITLQPVWEGLNRRCWGEAQLAELDRSLGQLDFLADGLGALRGERAFMNEAFGQMLDGRWYARPPGEDSDPLDPPARMSWPVRLVFPRWILLHNQALCNELQQGLIDAMDSFARAPASKAPLDLSITNRWARQGGGDSIGSTLARSQMRALGAFPQKLLRAQTTLNLARLACALERHRLAAGNYPPSLERLVPRYLTQVPPDLYDGKPLRYRLASGHRFLLYSVGPNATDEGGRVERNRSGGPSLERGDWVWPSAAAP